MWLQPRQGNGGERIVSVAVNGLNKVGTVTRTETAHFVYVRWSPSHGKGLPY